jgi:hypothetical protein
MSNINSIRRLSNKVLIILWIGLFLNPLVFTILWFYSAFNSRDEHFFNDLFLDNELPLSIAQAISGYLVLNITIFISMLIIWQLIKLFRLYREGDVFTAGNISCYKNTANLMILYVVMGYLEEIMLGVVLSYGQDDAAFGVSASDSDLTLLISGIIIRVIAKVMVEAKNLQDEQSLTI